MITIDVEKSFEAESAERGDLLRVESKEPAKDDSGRVRLGLTWTGSNPRLEAELVRPPQVQTAFESPDPWKHRSKNMLCPTCMYYCQKKLGFTEYKTIDGPSGQLPIVHSEIGRCRRHAPTSSGYPVVLETDWCGDHKLDENKT